MINSMGMKKRMKWKMILRTGHSPVFMSRHARGDSTSVSQAATVSVQTKKYLCALKCGGRLRDGGSNEVMSAMVIYSVLPTHATTTRKIKERGARWGRSLRCRGGTQRKGGVREGANGYMVPLLMGNIRGKIYVKRAHFGNRSRFSTQALIAITVAFQKCKFPSSTDVLLIFFFCLHLTFLPTSHRAQV